jgi:1-deoxy-D-xylulose-5-phosphate reductoisomerase
MQTLTILGATGSIGQSTLAVIAHHPERYRVYALTAYRQYNALIDAARVCQAQVVVLSDESCREEALAYAHACGYQGDVRFGQTALSEVSCEPCVDMVMAAIVGAAGLAPTFAAVQAGKTILLANKEALVMSGALFMDAARQANATILPIDSEHNAIFQCLPSDYRYGEMAQSGISKILLTGSGGPFLNTPLHEFADITPAQACAHPNWDMGQKISVDSATMMNKGLEFIEAKWLFGLNNDDIHIVLHPQSVIHSMVQYCDGSVLAQMGQPDMRTPIAHALAHPERIESGVAPLDFSQLSDFSFSAPDPKRYPNLYLTLEAAASGQNACTFINASNEIAVDAFLQTRIGFTDIARINAAVLAQAPQYQANSLEDIYALDAQARQLAVAELEALTC